MSPALPDAGNDTDTGTSAPVAPDRPMFDLRARAIETGLLVASVVALRLVGVLLLVVSSYELGSIAVPLVPLVLMVVDPNLLVWIAVTAAVQFGLRSMRRPGRWALIVLAAPVAVFAATAVRSLPGRAGAGFGAVLGSGIAWIDAGILTAVVALSLAFTAAFLGRERRRSARIAGGLLALGGLLTLVLVWQAFETYFTLWGAPVTVTPAQEDRYLVTAALTLVAYVGAVVLAALSRRRALIITACIVGCLGVIVAFAVPVPADRFDPEPAPPADARQIDPPVDTSPVHVVPEGTEALVVEVLGAAPVEASADAIVAEVTERMPQPSGEFEVPFDPAAVVVDGEIGFAMGDAHDCLLVKRTAADGVLVLHVPSIRLEPGELGCRPSTALLPPEDLLAPH